MEKSALVPVAHGSRARHVKVAHQKGDEMTEYQMLAAMLWVFGIIATPIVASKKGKDAGVWFLIGLVFGLLGWVAALLTKPADQSSG
jgi:hypothetical protein